MQLLELLLFCLCGGLVAGALGRFDRDQQRLDEEALGGVIRLQHVPRVEADLLGADCEREIRMP